MTRWPRRRAHGVERGRARPRRPTPVRTQIAAAVPVSPEVSPVPRRRRDAGWALIINLGVLAVIAFLAYRTVQHWDRVEVPGQVALALIGALTLLSAVLYLVSILVYLVPRLLGLRGPRGAEPPQNDSL